MASKKVLSGELVVHLLEQMLEGQDQMRSELSERIDGVSGKLDGVISEQRVTNERLDRIEQAVVGVGRMSALEERVRRLEERSEDPSR